MAVRPSVVFFFNYANVGWSERYWYAPNTINLNIVAINGAELLKSRVRCFPRAIECAWAYASYDDEFRDVKPIPLPRKQRNGVEPVWNPLIDGNAAEPNACLVLRMYSDNRAGKFIYLSGIDVAYTAMPGGTHAPFQFGAMGSAVLAFIEALIPTWGWKGLDYSPITAPLIPITAMVANGLTWTATVTDATLFKVGLKGKMTDARFLGSVSKRPNRVYTITGKVGNVLTLDWGTTDLDGLTYLGEGKLQPQVITILPFTGGSIYKVGSRKRGVGFGPSHGRLKRK